MMRRSKRIADHGLRIAHDHVAEVLTLYTPRMPLDVSSLCFYSFAIRNCQFVIPLMSHAFLTRAARRMPRSLLNPNPLPRTV